MKERAVLRVSRTDDDANFVLVHVTTGTKGVAYELEATDGSYPYALSLRNDKISKLKDKKHPIAENEWERILAEVLLDRQSDPDIEIAAQVADEQSIILIVRRSISGIKQRIGTVTLDYKDNELDIFAWCGEALASKRKVEDDLRSVTFKAEELENAVKELKGQLEELIEAKKSDESELLVKFRDLLNEKKVKIREQQRLLASYDVSPEETGVMPSPPRRAAGRQQTKTAGGKGHVPKPSRTSKRKAAEPEPEEEDDDLEKMDVDTRHGEADSEEDRTTDVDAGGDDDETGSEPDGDEEEEDGEPVPARRKGAKKGVDKPPAANTRHASQRKVETPPPPRTLPFNQRKAAAKPAPEPEPEPEGSETESDDEL